MKKRLNILCALVFLVLLVSMSETLYSAIWGGIEGAKAGCNATPDELNNLHPLFLQPNSLEQTSDSIYNALSQTKAPIWHSEAMVIVETEESGWMNFTLTLVSLLWFAAFVMCIVMFLRFIRNINHSEIFCYKTVKTLRGLGICLLTYFIFALTYNYCQLWEVSQVLDVPGYSFNWMHGLSDYTLLLSVLAFVFAEVFAIGLRLKDENDLTI